MEDLPLLEVNQKKINEKIEKPSYTGEQHSTQQAEEERKERAEGLR